MTETLGRRLPGTEQTAASARGAFAASWLFVAHASELAAPASTWRASSRASRSSRCATGRRALRGVPQRAARTEPGRWSTTAAGARRRSFAATTAGCSSATARLRSARDFGEPGPTDCRLLDVRVDGLARARVRQPRRHRASALAGARRVRRARPWASTRVAACPRGSGTTTSSATGRPTRRTTSRATTSRSCTRSSLARSRSRSTRSRRRDDWCVHRAPPPATARCSTGDGCGGGRTSRSTCTATR